MSKKILVCADGSDIANVAIEYAIYLGKHLDGHVKCVHVIDSRILEGPLASDVSEWIGPQSEGEQIQVFRDILEKKAQEIIDSFNKRCADAGVSGEGEIKRGHPPTVLRKEAEADVIVLGQRGLHTEFIGKLMGSTAENVVRRSNKPCLVTPGAFKEIRKILVAYDGSEHARQALREAADLTKKLNAELVLLTVSGEDEADADVISKKGLDLVESDGFCPVPIVLEAKHVAEAILENAKEKGSDLIVMGAYGHSRIREFFLGSTTSHVITHSEVPVLFVR